MAENVPVDPHGIRIEIERGAELESAELNAALEQLAKAIAGLEAPEPIESDDDEVQGFSYLKMDPSMSQSLRIGDVMGGAPKIAGPGPMQWCLGRCMGNSGDSCGSYCWVEA